MRGQKKYRKINRAKKCSILGPQNLLSRGGGWIRSCKLTLLLTITMSTQSLSRNAQDIEKMILHTLQIVQKIL